MRLDPPLLTTGRHLSINRYAERPMTAPAHSTLQTDVRALEMAPTVDAAIALLNGWNREYRGKVLGQFLFADPHIVKRAERQPRRPGVAALIKRAEKTGRRVTSITTPDGMTIKFDTPESSESQASDLDQWLAKRAKHARQT
jgi:hypothetical protein